MSIIHANTSPGLPNERRRSLRIPTPGWKTLLWTRQTTYLYDLMDLSQHGLGVAAGPRFNVGSTVSCAIECEGDDVLMASARICCAPGVGQRAEHHGLEFLTIGQPDSDRLDAIIARFQPVVQWNAQLWMPQLRHLGPQEAAAVAQLSAAGFDVADASELHPDFSRMSAVAQIVVTADADDLCDAVAEVARDFPDRRVLGTHAEPGDGALEDLFELVADADGACSACREESGLLVVDGLPVICTNCMVRSALFDPEWDDLGLPG